MTPVGSAAQVFDAIDRVKAPATAFCTNFFPIQKRLEAWVEQGELFADTRDGAAFFFRRDRDLWHLYFSARDLATLLLRAETVAELRALPVTTDVVGSESAVAETILALERAGFRRYDRLQRMARAAQPLNGTGAGAGIQFGERADGGVVLELLESSFNRFADQLPTACEIETALASRQVLVVKSEGALAAMLFFETQGLSSTLRYWAVAGPFRSKGFGSALMRHYFESQCSVRRFILWVASGNRNAVEKYEHYGYKADGLIDQVLANEMIPA